MKTFKRIAIFALVAAIIAECMGISGRVSAKAAGYADTSGYESLKEVFSDYFKVGVAVQACDHWGSMTASAEIGNENKEKLINEQFNSMTFGNEFKPAYNFSATEEGLFKVDFAAEELLEWAKANNMPVRGHCLVWHSQVNPSIFAKDFKATVNGMPTTDETAALDEDCLVDRETLLARLKTYIYSVIEYTYKNGYADIIYAWDVVNEASDEGKNDCLRRSYWYQIIGDDFLYYCFLYAREAENLFSKQYAADYGLDPEGDLSSIKAELFYNDYNEWFGGRVNGIIDFCTKRVYNEGHAKVQSDAIDPNGDGSIYGDGLIDGIGMQGHLTDTQSIEQYRSALKQYSDAVGNVHITELDIGKSASGDEGEFKQAKCYYDFFKMLVDEVKAGTKLTSVTLWGLTDTSSWRADSEPLLFYQYLDVKPAFKAVIMAGKGEEFTLTSASQLKEASDTFITFEPAVDESGAATPADYRELGFGSRGTGHQANFMLSREANHTPDIKMGFSLKASRKEADATVRMIASQYIGHTVKVTAYVKTKDNVVRTGFDTGDAADAIEVPASPDDFTEIVFYRELDADLKGADLFFETDGSGTMYIDDVSIELWDGKDIPETSATAGNISDEQPSPDAPAVAEDLQASENTNANTKNIESNKAAEENTDLIDTVVNFFGNLTTTGIIFVALIAVAFISLVYTVVSLCRRKKKK